MAKFNDIDLRNWKDSDVWTDSLWIIKERDRSGKHDGFYHGNFIPQVPRQLIKKFSKQGDVVLDLFLGSGTTAYEAESLGRNFIGVDISSDMVKYVTTKLDKDGQYFAELLNSDSGSPVVREEIGGILRKYGKDFVQLAILHPPYADIIKFSQHEQDLSNAKSLKEFLRMFSNVLQVADSVLEKGRYLAIVIGDIYKQGEWVPLGFYCMHEAQKLNFRVKSIVVKNMAGNRGKQGGEGIWRYRSLAGDYYVFKHEYVIILKKS